MHLPFKRHYTRDHESVVVILILVVYKQWVYNKNDHESAVAILVLLVVVDKKWVFNFFFEIMKKKTKDKLQ